MNASKWPLPGFSHEASEIFFSASNGHGPAVPVSGYSGLESGTAGGWPWHRGAIACCRSRPILGDPGAMLIADAVPRLVQHVAAVLGVPGILDHVRGFVVDRPHRLDAAGEPVGVQTEAE